MNELSVSLQFYPDLSFSPPLPLVWEETLAEGSVVIFETCVSRITIELGKMFGAQPSPPTQTTAASKGIVTKESRIWGNLSPLQASHFCCRSDQICAVNEGDLIWKVCVEDPLVPGQHGQGTWALWLSIVQLLEDLSPATQVPAS